MDAIIERAEAVWDAAHAVYEQIWTTDINKKQARREAVSIIVMALKVEREKLIGVLDRLLWAVDGISLPEEKSEARIQARVVLAEVER